MSKRRLIRWSLILAMLTAFGVWVEPTRVVWGWLRREAFYQGRPTSYWAEQIRPWKRSPYCSFFWTGGGVIENHQFRAARPPWSQWLNRYVQLAEPAWPAVLDGDPTAATVLDELTNHEDFMVRDWAAEGRERIETKEKGPVVYRSYAHGAAKRRIPGDGPPELPSAQVVP